MPQLEADDLCSDSQGQSISGRKKYLSDNGLFSKKPGAEPGTWEVVTILSQQDR